MPILYAIHNSSHGKDLTDGKRNCRTFLYGVSVYAVIYVLLKQAKLKYGRTVDAFLSGLLMVFLADCAVMGYTYKSYYGRSIISEFEVKDDWVYDKETHRYREKTKSERYAERVKEKLEIEEMKATLASLKEQQERADRYRQITETKERIRAAKVTV